jgi:cyclic pyranopterin phosphate synthase
MFEASRDFLCNYNQKLPMPGWYNSNMAPKLTHLDDSGSAHMVDVGNKAETERLAIAGGEVLMKKETLDLIRAGTIQKGDVLTVAQIAGITAAKRTADLIPLCHPLPLTFIDVKLTLDESLPGVFIRATVKTNGKTGVEMEALTAVSVAALTVYDMAKAIEKTMKIINIRLIEKRGGRSGDVINEVSLKMPRIEEI